MVDTAIAEFFHVKSMVAHMLAGMAFCSALAFGQTPQATTVAPQPKTTVIRFYVPVTEDTVSRLLNVVDAKVREGTKRIVLLISSPGGSVFAGLSAYHYLKGI